MSKDLYELRDMLMDELEKITSKGELTAGSLETVDKLTHSIKSIDTICAMEEAGGDYSYNDGGSSYARGRGRNANRDSRGRYSSEGGNMGGSSYEGRGGSSYEGRGGSRYSRRGYSRTYGGYSGDNKEELVENLRDLMENATDEKSRMAIHKAIKQLEE